MNPAGPDRSDWVALEVAGVTIGHWNDSEARTGCSVVVFPAGTVASGEVRGGAPATREFALLAPERQVSHVDAVLLSGGSAFGLAAADGVMAVLEAEGRGFETAHGPVPIVVGMALYDLGVGDRRVRPAGPEGAQAATVRFARTPTGQVGAGSGATVSKWLGADKALPGGLGVATTRRDELVVTAIVVANASGTPNDISPETGEASEAGEIGEAGETSGAGIMSAIEAGSFQGWNDAPAKAELLANTSLCLIISNAALDKLGCFWVAQGGHDGLARAFVPAHRRSDGDAVVATASGSVTADVDVVRLLAVAAVSAACRNAVGS